ncbi:g2535 [Coccomyxa viridis]|uniref:G2535 protein n=1 Tax=Coccomyxa viridis TaxID=1274662 RepID=A0ABP1FPB4_9CHLO
MLTLEEKGIPYNKLLIDELNMPEWIQEVSPEKQIPFGTELESGKWLYDSDKMIPYLEDKYSDRKKLGKPDDVDKVGTNLMPSLIEYLTSKGSEEEEKRTALLGVLREINNALQKSDGPYFGGKDVNAADLRVAPQLKHVMIGTKAIKDFQFPGELHGIHTLLEAMEGRQSWKKTYYTEKYVSDGWHKKMEVMGAK